MVVVAAGVTSLLFVASVLASLAYNPRLWVQDFPEPIQEAVDPLSRRERVARVVLAIPLFAVVFGIPLASVLGAKAARGGLTPLEGFVHLWSILMVVNLVDLVVVDWLVGVWWEPAFLTTPEIEPHLQHNTYRFHLVEHAKGTLMLTVAALVLGWLVSL